MIHTNRTYATSLAVNAFGGISSAKISDRTALDCVNFRLCGDGSLSPRCGFETLYSYGTPLRGYWEGLLSGSTYRFWVAGKLLYRLSDSDTSPVLLSSLGNYGTPVSFFVYRDTLYLSDGHVLLYFKPSTELFVTAGGYVPLYGKDWNPETLGEVNEPLNLLTTTLRLTYDNSIATQTFRLPYTAVKIRSVTVDGSVVTDYTFSPPSSCFRIPPTMALGGKVSVVFDIDSIFSGRSDLLSAYRTALYRDASRERLLLYGESTGRKVYCSTYVDDEMLDSAREDVPACDALYFRADGVLSLGSAEEPVTAIVQHYDRFLVFSTRGLWAVRSDGSVPDVLFYRSGIGCISYGGAVLVRGVPYVLTSGGIAKITLPSGDPDLCSAELLPNSPTPDGNTILFWSEFDGLLRMRNTLDTGGTVWVFDPAEALFVRDTGIPATAFIETGNSVGFLTADGRIAKFSPSLTTDDGTEISCVYKSAYLGFGTPEDVKRSGEIFVTADTGGATLSLILEGDNGLKMLSFEGKSSALSPEFFRSRFSVGRFRFLRYVIEMPAVANARLYAVKFNITI